MEKIRKVYKIFLIFNNMKKEIKNDNKIEEIKISNLKDSKVSKHFVTILAIVSIMGFIGIISKTLFLRDIETYIDSLLMIIVGFGLIFESSLNKLVSLRNGLDTNNFTNLITITIGLISVAIGILGLPFFKIENPSFFAMKGIISLIAIVIIIIQTWIVDTFPKKQ